MKKLLLCIVLVIIGAGGFIYSQPQYRWFALNTYKAQPYADKLLAGNRVPPPAWAQGLLVAPNMQEQLVMFIDDKHQLIFAYSPHKFPHTVGKQWHKVFGSWYISKQ